MAKKDNSKEAESSKAREEVKRCMRLHVAQWARIRSTKNLDGAKASTERKLMLTD